MKRCELCKEQAGKGRRDGPHERLLRDGSERSYPGGFAAGRYIDAFEERDYVCEDCETKFMFSNDKNDFGWIVENSPPVK